MQSPRRTHDWEHWPEQRGADETLRSRLRHLFAPGADIAAHEQAIQELLEERGRELEAQTTQLAESIAGLEQREARARELRAGVDEMLRRGSSQLDERHAELNAYAAELTERETAIVEQERALTERRTELGAVELRRAAVEGRERSAAELSEALEVRATSLDAREAGLADLERQAADLERRNHELESAETRLADRERGLLSQGRALAAREAVVQERERQLGAAEERARALERLRTHLLEREAELQGQRDELEQARTALSSAVRSVSEDLGLQLAEKPVEREFVVLVPAATGYRLATFEGPLPTAGSTIETDGERYVIVRIGASPLPGDARRCAYAVRED